MDSVDNAVAVLGTGTIGASWAAFYAVHDMQVTMFDDSAEALDAGAASARAHLDKMSALGLVPAESAAAAQDRLSVADSLESMAEGAVFVQESVKETYEVKKDVFARLDKLLPASAIIASSSSGLLISEIQTVMAHPERALIAHPFNPPHLIPLVELVAGKHTSPGTVDRARSFFESKGKTPVVLHKEIPGHIANRLAAALWREAIDLVASGVASVEDVDKALRAGPGLRWAIMGQHMIYHLGGGPGGYEQFIDHIGKAFEEYWQTMATWTEIPSDAKTAIIAGVNEAAGEKSLTDIAADRDQKLAAIIKALN